MKNPRTLAAAALTALALLAGCGGGDTSSPTPTTAAGSGTTSSVAATTTVAATSTTRSADSLKAALLQPADVPGATAAAATDGDADLSACFPGNPLGAKTDPGEVDSPDLSLTQGSLERTYSSSARVATPEQAKSFVATFGSATGSSCVLEAFKATLAAPPNPVDASGLTGKASSAAVADGGSMLAVSGTITAQGNPAPIAVELVVFQKGSVVVLLSAGAFGGALQPGQALELARTVAGRLS